MVIIMEISIKYCGGCNPRYDRAALVEMLKKENPDVIFSYADENKETDFLLVICGCTATCALYDTLKSRHGLILVSNEVTFEQIQDKINCLKNEVGKKI